MKKSSKTTKPKETVANVVESPREPSVIRPSLHPWYYVKGRKDLTEKNISSRREREEQKHKQWVSNSQYFDKRFAETQIFHKWNDNKSLVRHPKNVANASLKPPYDVFIEPKPNPRINLRLNKELEKKYTKAKQKLTEFMEKFKELDENYGKLEKQEKGLIFQLKQLRKIKSSVEEKTLFYEFTVKRLSQNRFSGVKLRKKVFLIIEDLNYFKISVKKIEILKNCEEILTGEELVQITEVIERALKILQMYIDLNETRNDEFQNMFDEELDNRWETQEIEWKTEYEVWNVMTQKLIQSYINIIKEKLSQLLTQESNALESRQQLVKELTAFTAKIKTDSNLSILLSENIEDFLKEVNENNDPNC